jgi:RHS repeat-associated protein
MKKIKYTYHFLLLLVVSLIGVSQTSRAQSIPLTKQKTVLTGTASTTSNSPTYTASKTTTSTTGSTAGSFAVSLTGAATYSIPFSMPPGIKDITPSVGLSFSSQAGNGLAGWGWNISGLSTISRVPTTKFHDGIIDPVDFDSNDRYSLDGQRLLLKSGSYGANDSEYQTENYSNVIVKAYGSNDTSGPAYFIVYFPDGSKAWYGDTSNGNIIQGARGLLEWALYRKQDPQGNFVAYSYINENNILRINTIEYGSNGSLASPNEIKFDYKVRTRPEVSYVDGKLFKNEYILNKVEVNGKNELYRKYQISYDTTSLGYEKISSVTESNGSYESFSPIQFTYDSTPDHAIDHEEITTNSTLYNSTEDGLFAGDFDGDGKTDIGTFKVYGNEFSLFKDLSDNTSAHRKSTSETIKQVFTSTILSTSNKILTKQAITTVSDLTDQSVSFKTYVSNGNIEYQYATEVNLPYYTSTDCTNGATKHMPFRYFSGDFNGDGVTDVMALGKEYKYRTRDYWLGGCESTEFTGGFKHAYFIDLKRFAINDTSSPIGYLEESIADEDIVSSGDFNGDGKTDIYHFKENKVYIYTFNNNQLELLIEYTNGSIKVDRPILVGDYNGDGKSDFLIPSTTNGNNWRYHTATGTTFASYETTAAYYNGSDYYHYLAQDINGDGKTDLLEHYKYTSYNTYRLRSYLNLDTGSNLMFQENTFTGTYSDTNPVIPVILEVKQSNYNPEIVCVSSNRIDVFKFPKSHQQEMTLNSIQSNQIITNINYQRLGLIETGETSIYTEANSQTYPYVNINKAPNYNFVEQVVINSGNITQTQDYKYGGAISHTEGFGFLGFKTFIKSNWYGDGVGRLWNVSLHDPQKRGAVTSQWLSESSSTSPYSFLNKTDYTYQTTLASNKVFTSLPTITNQENSLTGVSSRQTITYDAYKNPLTTINEFFGGTTTSKTKTFTYTNSTSLNNYYIGRPTKVVETSQLGAETFSAEQQMTYTDNLVETLKKKGNGDTGFITETFTYDTYGNLLTKTLSATGISRTESFTYDSSKRFLLTSTDIEGLVTSYEYNYSNGNPTKTTNPFGLITEFVYDNWGRLKTETDYLGKNTSYTYNTTNIDGQWALSKASYFADGGEEVSYFNAFGWLVKSKVKTLNNYIHQSYEYDAIGRILRESEPYFSAASQWSQKGYDSYGRLISQQLYTGKVINTTYSGLSVTVDDGTKTKTVTKNAIGNITKVTDPGGMINYAYYANGSMKQASYGTNTVRTEIDGWGRKTKLVDPSAGTYTYSYDILGNIKTETTPKGTTSFDYDNNGKIISKTIIGDLTDLSLTYQYDESDDKLLDKIIGDDNITSKSYLYEYEYNSDKTPKSIKEITPTAEFEKILTYDGFGRVETEKYISKHLGSGTNSTIHTKNVFDSSSGILREILNNTTNASLWKINEENAKGQATSISLGNGFTKVKTYDNLGFLNEIRDAKEVNNIEVSALKMDYTYNTTRGILTNRKNYAFSNWEENFNYDAQDRLTNITGAITLEQQYDEKGRIETNSNLGAYNYNPSKIYQLNKIELNAFGKTHFENHALQQISYNAFKKPVSIYQENNGRIDFEYGPLQNRTNAYYGGSQTDKSSRQFHKQYSSIIPVEMVEDKTANTIKIVSYIGGDGYTAPIAHIKKTGNNAIDEYHFLHRDYLGSILAITNNAGDVKEQRQFGAWGKVDKFLDSSGNTIFEHNSLIGRGYTGHEHFFEVDLIHMNGRMYDANLGRFLSPDNYIQDPYNTQSFNRYGYVWNNPLMNVDPSGELVWFAAALIGAAISVAVNGIANVINDRPFFEGAGSAALIGAIGGAVASGIGGVTEGLKGFTQVVVRGVLHGYAGGFMSAFSGGNFGSGLLSGFVGSAIGSGSMKLFNGASKFVRATASIASAGFAGGVTSELSGGKFSDGLRNGILSASLNHVAHGISQRISLKNIIKNAGYDPQGVARLNASEIKTFIEDIFPEMYDEANNPDFVVKDYLENNAMGKVKSSLYKKGDLYTRVEYDGNVYLKKPVLNSYIQLASTVGHELQHIIFGNNNAVRLVNAYGKTYFKGATEVNSHSWEQSVQSPFFNQARLNAHQAMMNN